MDMIFFSPANLWPAPDTDYYVLPILYHQWNHTTTLLLYVICTMYYMFALILYSSLPVSHYNKTQESQHLTSSIWSMLVIFIVSLNTRVIWSNYLKIELSLFSETVTRVWWPHLFLLKGPSLIVDMDDPLNTWPICDKKILRHSYTVCCQCCRRHVHRNCTTFSHEEFLLAQNTDNWYSRLCNENIFPFNQIETDSEFEVTLKNFMTSTLEFGEHFLDPNSKIFNPFEINEEEHIFEYQSELDPDKNYFNQFSHYLSRSNNYYSEETFNKYLKRNSIDGNDFSLIHSNIRSVPANLTSFLCYLSNTDHIFFCYWFLGNMANSL